MQLLRVALLARVRSKRFYSAAPEKLDCFVEHLNGQDEGIQVISFARPAAKNALSRKMLTEFQDALENIRYDPNARVVILKSTVPKVFCAG
jgi:methylglutaconyl-CoA hydratase